MRQIQIYRALLWPIAIVTCVIVVFLSFIFTYLSVDDHWLTEWMSIPLIPFLPIIICVFLYGVRRVHRALKNYEIESKSCRLVSDAIKLYSTPAEIQARLISVTKGNTSIGKRVAYALESTDVEMASAIMQLPQPMDIEEDKTFGELQFWRSALVLIGLLSTVVFFALAFTATGSRNFSNLNPLINDLQRALTMTMAGIATSVVLGGMSTRLFDIQQNLKLYVDELTALMLPRLAPHYEKGTKEEPGPALVLEKLQDFFREVETWKTDIGTDVERLARVLIEHREVMVGLPAISLPEGFSNLNTTLSQVSTTMTETREIIERALQVLSESRDLDLNNIVNLLAEIRTDSERIKTSQIALLDRFLPKQTEALEQLNILNSTLQKVADGLNKNAEQQGELTRTNKAIQEELSRLRQPRDEQLINKMQEMVNAIKGLQREAIKPDEGLRFTAPSSSKVPSTVKTPVVRTEPTRPVSPPPPPRPEPSPGKPLIYNEPDRGDEDGRSRLRRMRDWFSDRFYSL